MLPLIVRNNRHCEKGVTLLEIIVTTVVIGILAGLTMPNMFSMLAKNKLNKAVDDTVNALQSAQRQAIRRSKSCKISLTKGTGKYTINLFVPNEGASPDATKYYGCLLEKQELSEITLTTNATSQTDSEGIDTTINSGDITNLNFTFSGKGMVTDMGTGSNPLVIVFSAQGTQEKKCIIVTPIVGLTRIGDYSGTGANPAQCIVK